MQSEICTDWKWIVLRISISLPTRASEGQFFMNPFGVIFSALKIHDWTEIKLAIAATTLATIKDITDSYRRLNTKAAVTVFLIYDVAFAMVMPCKSREHVPVSRTGSSGLFGSRIWLKFEVYGFSYVNDHRKDSKLPFLRPARTRLALRENQRASYIFQCTYLSALKYHARYARWFYAVWNMPELKWHFQYSCGNEGTQCCENFSQGYCLPVQECVRRLLFKTRKYYIIKMKIYSKRNYCAMFVESQFSYTEAT